MKKFKVFALVFAIMLSATGLGLLFGTQHPASNQAKVSADSTPSETWYTDWTYTKNDGDKTISLTAYNGTETNYVVPATATIDSVEYNVIFGTEDDANTDKPKVSTGKITQLSFATENNKKVKFPAKADWLFNYDSSLISIDLANVDTRDVTTMTYMFGSCSSLSNINFGNINTSKVTDMQFMFYSCKKIASLDLSTLDTKNVEDMTALFFGCEALQQIKFGTNFTTTTVKEIDGMFGGCTTIKKIDLSSFELTSISGEVNLFFWADNYCDEIQTIISPKSISNNATLLLPNFFYKVVVFKDTIGNMYETTIPQGQITLNIAVAPYFKFTIRGEGEDRKKIDNAYYSTLYTIEAIDNGFGNFEQYKNDKYSLLGYKKNAPDDFSFILKGYLGTRNDITIPSKIILRLDEGEMQGKDTNGNTMELLVNLVINDWSNGYWGEQSSKITSLTFGADYDTDKISCTDISNGINQLTALKFLNLSGCKLVQLQGESKSLEEIKTRWAGMLGEENCEKFYNQPTTAKREAFIRGVVKQLADSGEIEGLTPEYLASDDFAQLIKEWCFVPANVLTRSVKTIIMPTAQAGDNTPEITLNGDYTYGDNQTTNKFTYGGETLSYVEGTGSVVDDPSSPETPTTGVVLNVILPVASITLVLASLCAVAFVGKKKRQF